MKLQETEAENDNQKIKLRLTNRIWKLK
jgi:hypothetical protein